MASFPHVIPCTKCETPLRLDQYPEDASVACPGCGQRHLLWVARRFLEEAPEKGSAGAPALADEASCFFHPDRRAEAVCDLSGRYLCALCTVEFNGRTYSMEAFEALRREGTAEGFVERATRYDRMALLLAILPPASVLFWLATLITAPMALALGLYALTRPRLGPVRWGPWTAWLAILLALAEITVWALNFSGHLNLL